MVPRKLSISWRLHNILTKVFLYRSVMWAPLENLLVVQPSKPISDPQNQHLHYYKDAHASGLNESQDARVSFCVYAWTFTQTQLLVMKRTNTYKAITRHAYRKNENYTSYSP